MLAGVVRLHRLVGTISLCRILHTVKVQCKFHFQLKKKTLKDININTADCRGKQM